MKSAKKILSVFLAVLMLFSVMSVGFSSIAATVTVGSLTANEDGSLNDTYETTDDVVICVPETIYMTPGDGESVKGQYYVNNAVNSSGVVSIAAERSNGWGAISIYAPGSTAFSFTANAVSGGIGDPIIGNANTSATATYEGQRWENTALGGTTGYVSYSQCALYINGKGLTFGQTALIEWKVTVYYGADDTTGKSYYAYTTLYMPIRSVGAVSESRMTSDKNNEISSWISGVTGSGSRKSVSSDRVGDGGATADGYLTYDPLWTSTFGVGSTQVADDYVTNSDTVKTAHAVAVNGDQWTRSVGYLGYLTIDSSRYTNTDQIPNFQIGADVLRIEDKYPNNSLESHNVWYTMGAMTQVDQTTQEPIPEGWDAHPVDYDGDGKEYRWSIAPSYSVSDVDGKYIHVASQAHCKNGTTTNYANAYVSVQFSVTDKSDLRALVIQATSLDETKYTVDSWRGAMANVVQAFHEALRDAAMVLGNPAASQGSIDSALANLNEYINALKVTVTFDAETNGGMFTDGEVVKEYNVRFGTATKVSLGASLLNYFSVAKNGYELAGWSTNPDDPSTASLSVINNITFGTTLYAHYKKTIAVDFHYLVDKKGNTDVRTNELTIYNHDDKALDVFVDDADDVDMYQFTGWTLDPESTEGMEIGSELTGITENAAYYATYLKELTLNFDVDGGTFDKASVSGGVGYNYNLTQSTGVATVTIPENEPSKTGYDFEGWDIGGTVYQPGDEVEFSGNTTEATATAVWGVQKYDITFKFKDEAGKDISIVEKIEYGQAVTAPEVPDYYSNESMHHAFTGWDNTLDNITSDIVVTAQYASGVSHNYTAEGSFPTCDEAGEVKYTCSICGYSYTYSSDALGHSYFAADSKDANCEEDGYIVWVCNRDSSHTYTEVLKATGHAFENTEYVDSTCTEDGYYISGVCNTCGVDLAGKIIPAKGHDYQVVDSKAETCTEDGYEVYECSRCDSSYTKTLEATGHDYIITSVAPTCTQDGKNSYYCSKCGYLHDVRVPALGHSYISIIFPPTCSANGYTSLTCTICGTAVKTNEVPALGHEYVESTVAPTCTAQGYNKHTCSVCNYSYKTDYVDALGHDYSIVTVVEPTCTENGYTLHECATCGGTYKSDFIAEKGHNYEQVEYVNATVTQNGYYLLKCKDCGLTSRDYVFGDKALLCITLKDTSGNIVKGATITFTDVNTGKQIVVVTDNNGYFTHFIPDGDYTIEISRSGYFCDSKGDIKVELGTADIQLPEVAKNSCSCLCHQDSFIAKIFRFIYKIFSIFGARCCDCSEI